VQINLNLLIALGLCLLPVVLAVLIIFRKRTEHRAFNYAPFKELQRRPAGEALRIKLEALEEKLTEQTYGLVMFPSLLTVVLLVSHPKDATLPIFFFVISASSSAYFGMQIYSLVRMRANYRLGYEGERLVGEELSRLILLGFEIYHDVPFDGFNIDHVLVGPRGVFVVETKTRRKPLNQDGKKEYRVQFDGKSLLWPNWKPDSYGIDQAKNNAKTLAAWLGKTTGENVWATAILTLPGWMVDLKVPCDSFYVLNPKQIFQVCAAQPEKILEPQVRRICHQLDQKCRIEVR